MSNEHEFTLPTASTIAAPTNILDLNDDCLRAIFSSEFLSIFDLSSTVETHSRFKQVVDGVFLKRYKKFNVSLGNVRSIEVENRNTRRTLQNFGPFISELSIFGFCDGRSFHYGQEFDLMLDWVTKWCSNTMESIELDVVEINEDRTMKLAPLFGKLRKISLKRCVVSSGKTLLTNCESLVVLQLENVQFNDQLNALRNTFPKLERFAYLYYWDHADVFSDSIENDFFSRHQNLKVLSLSRDDGISHLLPTVADNCKQLSELDIGWDEINFEKALSILSLGHLKKLKIDCRFLRRNITKFIQELRHSNSLEVLEYRLVQGDSEFIPALSKLTRLQVLKLEDCLELTNLNSLADLERLTELKIVSHQQDLDLDVVCMIKRLINLKTLHLDTENFELDQQTYLRIVDVVRGRPGRFPDALQITCRTVNDGSENSFADGNCRMIVKIIKLKN